MNFLKEESKKGLVVYRNEQKWNLSASIGFS